MNIKNKVYYAGMAKAEDMERAYLLGAPGFLTNSQGMLNVYGEDMTIDEIVDEALKLCHDVPIFPHIHGKDYKAIVEVGRRIHAKNPELVGCKILANEEGFKAIRILSEEGMKIVVTGLYTVEQALMAAQVGAFAISPFVHRGLDAGLDMAKNLKDMRRLYDNMENPPLIIAASIRTMEDATLSLENGADALASMFIYDACESELSKETEVSFAKAFSKIKGEDVSYILEDGNHDTSFEE